LAKDVQFDQTFVLLKDLIEQLASQKLEAAGLDVSEIRERAILGEEPSYHSWATDQ